MKALLMRAHGDLSTLAVGETPSPTLPDSRHALVRLKAAALNHLDLWTLAGVPGISLKFPHILGGDGAGIVEEVGSDVRSVKPGDCVMFNPGISCYRCEYCLAGDHSLCVDYRLLGEHVPGTLAEFIAIPEPNLALIPRPPAPQPEISWTEAAAFSLVTLTAWRMLVTRARLRPGEVVLIWGVGGGVSLVALKIAKLIGAFAIVTSGSDDKLAKAREIGADVTLNHATGDVAKEVRQLTNRRGADVVVENVGEATWEQSLRALGRGGRVVTCGGTTGHNLITDVRRLFWHQWTIMGSTMGNHLEYQEIVRLLGQGELRPTVHATFPLERAAAALEELKSAHRFGKIVVQI
ncbi:MAG: zinc-binding dehydrogenase [Gemmatimonadetes bacterium]|nr:zinc-binding dehydrogenase [Gemmatimonadota bacterium]